MRYDYSSSYRYSLTNTAVAPKQTPVKRAKISKLPIKKSRKSTGSATKKVLCRLAVAVALVFSVSFCIYSRVEISDVKTDIMKANKTINVLNSEGTKLEMELENKISYGNLEQAAMKLGMVKRTKSQTHYIDTSGEDYAEILSADGE